jgi:peptide/nickel transport system permease protein
MILYLTQRFILTALMLLILTFVVFLGVYYIGDPIALLMPEQARSSSIEEARKILGLEGSFLYQYSIFIKGLVSGTLGKSFVFGTSCFDIILERLPASLELTLLALLFSCIIGIKLGLHAARFPNSLRSKWVEFYALLGMSFPVYWLGLMLVTFFAAQLHWLPSIGRGDTFWGLSFLTFDGIRHLVLPVLVLMMFKVALFIRLTRHFASNVAQKSFIHFTRARGIDESIIYKKHIIKHLTLPISTIFSLEFGSLLLSAVITESVFAWPGLGKLLIDALLQLDRPMVIAFVLFVGLFYAIMHLSLDIIHRFIDPRLREKRWA